MEASPRLQDSLQLAAWPNCQSNFQAAAEPPIRTPRVAEVFKLVDQPATRPTPRSQSGQTSPRQAEIFKLVEQKPVRMYRKPVTIPTSRDGYLGSPTSTRPPDWGQKAFPDPSVCNVGAAGSKSELIALQSRRTADPEKIIAQKKAPFKDGFQSQRVEDTPRGGKKMYNDSLAIVVNRDHVADHVFGQTDRSTAPPKVNKQDMPAGIQYSVDGGEVRRGKMITAVEERKFEDFFCPKRISKKSLANSLMRGVEAQSLLQGESHDGGKFDGVDPLAHKYCGAYGMTSLFIASKGLQSSRSHTRNYPGQGSRDTRPW